MISPQESLAPNLSADAEDVGFKDIATIPKPGAAGLSLVKFSPDDRYVTYLGSVDATSLTRQLYAYDRETGETKQVITPAPGSGEEATFTREEQLRRERARIMSTGVTEYAWAAKANRILVPKDGAIFVQDGVGEGSEATLRRLFDPADARWAAVGKGPLLDAKISSDGGRVGFVWGGEVCGCVVTDASDGADAATPERLTFGARGTGKTNGIADYCAQEEMDRYAGFWFSPDGDLVAFEEVDEAHIPIYRIMHQGIADPHEQEEHRYPFAGAANPKVRLGVVPGPACSAEAGNGAVWFDIEVPFGADCYLARVQWAADGAAEGPVLLAQVQSRDQCSVALLKLDPRTGGSTTVLTETNSAWINLHYMLRPLKGKGQQELLWASERDRGWRQLYVLDTDGKMLRQLTSDCRSVEEVVSVNEEMGYVYFAAAEKGEETTRFLQRHLFRVRLDGSAPAEQLTHEAGYHEGFAVAHDSSCFVDQHSSALAPVAATLQPLPGAATPGASVSLYSAAAADPRVGSLATLLRPPRFVNFPSTDGQESLLASLYVPDAELFGSGPHPTVVSCYGGPHVQFVQDKWTSATADMRAQFLRSQGFLVLKVDNRGSDRRGLAFESTIKGDLGSLEVDDQAAVVRYAVDQGLADPERVGIYGWSYGGYLSAMCLAKEPSIFRCAVAGAPVTSWDGYDTHYTERYMGGGPQDQEEAYTRSSVMTHAKRIEGALLLVHGLIDENVHFRHTARLAQALVEEQKSYELLCFPSERHSPRSLKDRTFMESRVFSFLQRWLRVRPVAEP